MDIFAIAAWVAGSIGVGGFVAAGRFAWRGAAAARRYAKRLNEGLDAIHRTETRTRRIDARQHAMMNLFTAPVFSTDTDGQYTHVNQHFETMTGYGERELLGRGWISAVHPEDRDQVRSAWEQAIADKRAFKHAFRYRHRLGYSVIVRVEAQPLACDGELPFGWQGVVDWRGGFDLQAGRRAESAAAS
jgi:PAS domain S-box-containing protein